MPLRFLALTTFAMVASPVMADDGRQWQQVLETLRSRITERLPDSDTPIQDVLARHADATTSSISVDRDEKELPEQPADIDPEEWDALRGFVDKLDPDDYPSELRGYDLSLVDLDEDGRRDLVLYWYGGGTGLYSHHAVFSRDNDGGFRPVTGGADGWQIVYSINGRGADQALDLIRIGNRSHVAYRDGTYAEDLLTLDRPLSDAAQPAHAIRVRYHYTHTPAPGANFDAAFPVADTNQLLEETGRLLGRLATNGAPTAHAELPAQCPQPANADQQWPWRGPLHYSLDAAVDFGVGIGDRCFNATIVMARSSYLTSYEDCCWIWLHDASGAQVGEIPLHSRRRAVDVKLVPRPDHPGLEP